jgi:hypothetical protein
VFDSKIDVIDYKAIFTNEAVGDFLAFITTTPNNAFYNKPTCFGTIPLLIPIPKIKIVIPRLSDHVLEFHHYLII